MFDLNAAIDAWLAEAVASEPDLAPHADELGDHIHSVSRDRIESGEAPADALAAALGALGDASVLAAEFRKDGNILAHLRRLTEADQPPSRREHYGVAAAWIVLSLIWAGVMISVENSLNWALAAWTITTYLPLSYISVKVNKRAADAPSRQAC